VTAVDSGAAATRRELDQLTGWLTRLEQRISEVDQLGPRGMGAVIVQVSELTKDMGELGADQRSWQRSHREQHNQEVAQRGQARRWLIALAVGNAVALVSPWLVVITHH
jgi:hypothetical protein